MKTIRLLGNDIKISTLVKYISLYVSFIAVLLLLDQLPQSFLYESISWYGVIVGTGFLMGLVLCLLTCHYRKLDPDFFFTLILYVFPFAIVGARIYYVIFALDEFPTFYSMLAVWNGGLAIYGGIIGGAIAVFLACKIHKKSIIDTLDVIIPALLIGQAIGRWGNFVNQEAYGVFVEQESLHFFPFSVYIENCTQLAEGCLCGGEGYHLATFFYESLWNFVGFSLALWLLVKCPIRGIMVGSYFVYYGLGRVIIEGLRMDSLYLGVFRVSQLLSFILIIVGVTIITYLLLKHRRRYEEDNIVSST